MRNDKKFQKKVVQLIKATSKADLKDLELFMALIVLRFDLVDNDLSAEDTHFQTSIDLYNEFKNDNNIVYLLKK